VKDLTEKNASKLAGRSEDGGANIYAGPDPEGTKPLSEGISKPDMFALRTDKYAVFLPKSPGLPGFDSSSLLPKHPKLFAQPFCGRRQNGQEGTGTIDNPSSSWLVRLV
jgi:hypothetical protein